MRGIGDIILEHDFPPGSDIIGQIFSQLKAAKRIELELFRQWAAYTWDHIVFFNFYIVWWDE